MSKENLKKDIRFVADECLMYLIQQTSKHPTLDILGFFYDLGMKVADMGIDAMEGRGIIKDIRDLYPGTHIPFKLLVKGKKKMVWTPTGWSKDNLTFYGTIEVSFPDKARGVDHAALIQKIMENSLLDGESLPDFPQPKIKTPKMYKDLIEEVLKKNEKN